MTRQQALAKLSELKDSIELQEQMLSIGAMRLKEKEEEYNLLDRQCKELSFKKNRLLEEVTALTSTVELYSNF